MVYFLATIHTEKKLELLERLWVLHHHFHTYYHSGFEYSQNAVAVYNHEVLDQIDENKKKFQEMKKAADSFHFAWWNAMMKNPQTNDSVTPSLNSVHRYAALSKPRETRSPQVILDKQKDSTGFLHALPALPVNFEDFRSPSGSVASPHVDSEAPYNDDAEYIFTAFDKYNPVARNKSGQEIEKFGYLSKLTTSILKDWKRRWFHLKNGQLFYFRSAKKTDCELICDILLCNVRECHTELRNCFEIISPNRRVYVLQADTEYDMKEWIRVI